MKSVEAGPLARSAVQDQYLRAKREDAQGLFRAAHVVSASRQRDAGQERQAPRSQLGYRVVRLAPHRRFCKARKGQKR